MPSRRLSAGCRAQRVSFSAPVISRPAEMRRVLSFAVTVATRVADVSPAEDVLAHAGPAPIRTQQVRDTRTGEVAAWSVYDRAQMAPGGTVAGPCIVAEAETSTLVGPGWTCRVDGLGYLELTQEAR